MPEDIDDRLHPCPSGCREFLVRLDERSRRIEQALADMKTQLRNDYARQTNMLELKESVRHLESRTEDLPTVKRLVFGAVAIVLTAVALAIVALVVRGGL